MKSCPTPTKHAYESGEAARFFADARVQRAYPCPCGKWHLTTKRVRRPRARA